MYLSMRSKPIDKIIVQIRKEIEEKLLLKADAQDLWSTNGHIESIANDTGHLTGKLIELEYKVREMEETLSKCIKLDVPVTALDDVMNMNIKAYADNRN